MIEPPLPGVPALLLALAARLGFRVTTRESDGTEFGMFVDGAAERYLVVTSGGIDGTWAILDALPPDFGPFLLSRATYDILRLGRQNKDGSIAWNGRSYRVQMSFAGTYWKAREIVVQASDPAAR